MTMSKQFLLLEAGLGGDLVAGMESYMRKALKGLELPLILSI